jgi:hypothetical protein
MSALNDFPIPELYRELHNITDYGVAGYYVPKKY